MQKKKTEQLMGVIGWNDSELQKYSSLAVWSSHLISKIFVFKMKMMLLSGNIEWFMEVFKWVDNVTYLDKSLAVKN